jgi:hypothetical protein
MSRNLNIESVINHVILDSNAQSAMFRVWPAPPIYEPGVASCPCQCGEIGMIVLDGKRWCDTCFGEAFPGFEKFK